MIDPVPIITAITALVIALAGLMTGIATLRQSGRNRHAIAKVAVSVDGKMEDIKTLYERHARDQIEIFRLQALDPAIAALAAAHVRDAAATAAQGLLDAAKKP